MKWNKLNALQELSDLIEESHQTPILIFKYSTRCSISSTALSRLERKWEIEESKLKPYYLDLISHRDISDAIAQKFNVIHESPQALIIKNGKPIFDASHFDIDYSKIVSSI